MEPVAVWWAALSDVRPAHVSLLNEVERARRERYLREPDRHRFTLGASITRIAAGAILGQDPAAVTIDRSCSDCGEQHGRPVIEGGPHVSVSHSGDRVAVAVSSHGPLGVDVEAAGRATEGIAGHLLAPAERGGELTPDTMLAYWTRKEALVKATGDGLRVPLTDLHVSPPAEAPRLMDWASRAELVARITMVTLDPGPGYAACLALLDHPAGVDVVERPAAEILDAVPGA